jgi:DMSO/TMAO reductase YedYZ heme-binding membrane subunit
MIGFSVRWAVPFIYLVVAASAVQTLFPGPFPAWWLRNRKYIGLCFAVAMAWQGTFIFMLSNFYREHYYDNLYLLRDQLEGSIGYIFLTAMVVTSFQFGRKRLSLMQWKVLHRSALYFLFAYPFSVYWWAISYYGNPTLIDYVFYWCGFTAFALRIVAWGKKRTQAARKIVPESSVPPGLKALGGTVFAIGLLASVATLYTQDQITNFLTAPQWSAELVLWLPFWPFEPYLSLFIMGLGAMMFTKFSARTEQSRGKVLDPQTE